MWYWFCGIYTINKNIAIIYEFTVFFRTLNNADLLFIYIKTGMADDNKQNYSY
jgi:hypothetical protein